MHAGHCHIMDACSSQLTPVYISYWSPCPDAGCMRWSLHWLAICRSRAGGVRGLAPADLKFPQRHGVFVYGGAP